MPAASVVLEERSERYAGERTPGISHGGDASAALVTGKADRVARFGIEIKRRIPADHALWRNFDVKNDDVAGFKSRGLSDEVEAATHLRAHLLRSRAHFGSFSHVRKCCFFQ